MTKATVLALRGACLVLACFVMAVLVLTPQAIRAEFGDCMDADYLSDFGTSGEATGIYDPISGLTCIVEFDIPYETPGGTRNMRGIRDINADWAFRPGALPEVERGARAAIAALGMLGNYRVDDITILILDDQESVMADGEPERSILGVANGPALDDECLITAYLFGPGGHPEDIAQTIAHEIFHCVQAESLSPEQYSTVTGGGIWWGEGSAEYFATLALPDAGDMQGRATEFDEGVAAGTPLHDISYGMTVFFYWFHANAGGPSALMTFLSGMAPSNDAAAQRAAMRDALSDEQWLSFVEAYADLSITDPSGNPLAFGEVEGTEIYFDGNETETVTLEPFVVLQGYADHECGEWRRVNLSPSSPNVSVREMDTRDWIRPWPEEVDARAGSMARYRMVGLHTGDGAERVEVEVERTASCDPCGGTEEIDACLVGTWSYASGGAVEWMKSQGINITAANITPGDMTLRSDGIFITEPFGGGLTIEMDDAIGEGVGNLTAATGTWSAKDGLLNTCQETGGLSGQVTVTSPDATMTGPVSQPGAGMLQQSYTCSETTMTTTLDFPGLGPMTTTFSKVAEEAVTESE